MKHLIVLFLTILCCTSCMTQSKTFLAFKHDVDDSDIRLFREEKSVSNYSPYFDLKDLMEFTNNGITVENLDSVQCMYEKIKKQEMSKNNCEVYEVEYSIDKDTLNQRVYIIYRRHFKITHDNEVLKRMHYQIEQNIIRFINNNNFISNKIDKDTSLIKH